MQNQWTESLIELTTTSGETNINEKEANGPERGSERKENKLSCE